MDSSPHSSHPTFVQPPPPPNNTAAKTQSTAAGDIDRYLRIPPSLEISTIMWFTRQLLLIRIWPRQSFPLPAGTLVVSYCPWLSVTAQGLLEDCCLITLSSHSTPPVSRWRAESLLLVSRLALCISVNRFNVCSEWISDSTMPSFDRGQFCTGGGGDGALLRITVSLTSGKTEALFLSFPAGMLSSPEL